NGPPTPAFLWPLQATARTSTAPSAIRPHLAEPSRAPTRPRSCWLLLPPRSAARGQRPESRLERRPWLRHSRDFPADHATRPPIGPRLKGASASTPRRDVGPPWR